MFSTKDEEHSLDVGDPDSRLALGGKKINEKNLSFRFFWLQQLQKARRQYTQNSVANTVSIYICTQKSRVSLKNYYIHFKQPGEGLKNPPITLNFKSYLFSVKEIHFHPSSASGSKYVGMFFRDPEDMQIICYIPRYFSSSKYQPPNF